MRQVEPLPELQVGLALVLQVVLELVLQVGVEPVRPERPMQPERPVRPEQPVRLELPGLLLGPMPELWLRPVPRLLPELLLVREPVWLQ